MNFKQRNRNVNNTTTTTTATKGYIKVATKARCTNDQSTIKYRTQTNDPVAGTGWTSEHSICIKDKTCIAKPQVWCWCRPTSTNMELALHRGFSAVSIMYDLAGRKQRSGCVDTISNRIMSVHQMNEWTNEWMNELMIFVSLLKNSLQLLKLWKNESVIGNIN